MLVKVLAVQARMGQPLTLEEKIYIFKQRPDFVCLPEYWLVDDTIADYHRAALRRNEYLEELVRLSEQLNTCLIGGTIVDSDHAKLYNTCYVFNRGRVVGFYRKRYPVEGELRQGIVPGEESKVFEVEGVRFGIMICGDVFYPELYSELGAKTVDLIFIPTTSPFLPADSISRKRHRDQKYFLSGADAAGAFVVKTCGVGSLVGRPLQGRSLIAAPWGMLTHVEYDREQDQRILQATLDLAELHDFRAKRSRPKPQAADTHIKSNC